MFNPISTASGTLGSGAAIGGLLEGGMAAIPGWGWAALAGANLLGGLLGSGSQADERRREAQLRAAEIEAQPWTKQAAQTQISTATPNVWANLLGSGINTLSQGQALEKGMRESEASKQDSMWKQMMMQKLSQLSPQQVAPVLMGNKSYLNPWEDPSNLQSNQ
jgi:hypothetical protein